MIAKSYITRNLDTIERRFLLSKTRLEPLYYSKLAVLELCGWIEMSIDDLALRAIRKKVKDPDKHKGFKNNVMNYVHGFHYTKHFRRILCSAIGEIVVANIEQKMDQTKRVELESALNSLYKSRNTLAHTYVKGITQQIDAPSKTIQRFNRIYAGLKEFETEVFNRI